MRIQNFTYKNLEKNGRLGNQLWQIAWQIGSAANTPNGRARVKPNWDYRPYFSLPEELYDDPVGRIVNGDLFFQELYHWDHCKSEVWDWFQPSELSVNYLHNNYPEWLFDDSVNKTAIHVRAGDYLQHPTIFPVPSDQYYFDACRSVINEYPDTRFLLFSDNLDFAKKKVKFLKGEIHVVEGVARPVPVHKRKGEPQDQWDMFLISKCQQHVIANSTFSWWGAFLSKSNAVHYPSVWWGPDIDAKDSRGVDIRESWVEAIPNDWRRIEC